ncbi:MAG TPA: patatin family protein, partial [Methanocorpusculum sp.]|nr:patatin family protein [Methanocorpusculum sp.]
LIRDPDEEYMKLAATMALPIISKKVKLNGKKYLDGGIVDSLPIKQAFAAGNKKVVLVLTQDATYRKSINKILPLLWFWYLPYQKFVGKIATRHIRYNKALIDIAEAEKAGTAFVIRPKKPVEVGRLDFNPEKIEALYQDGYRDGLELMPKLKEFLKS